MSLWFIKRNRLIVGFIISALLFQVFQLAFVNPFLSIDDYRPDMLLILTLFIGFRFGHISGSLFGFYTGVLQDMMTGFMGIHALANTLTGYGVFYFSNRHVLVIERYYFPVVVFFFALARDAIYFYIYTLDSSLDFRPLFMGHSIPNGIYSALMALILSLGIPKRWLDYLRAY
jgi:rod shape-determining protein MreD